MGKNDHFAESMLKGRMAETLVEEMLRKSGNLVYQSVQNWNIDQATYDECEALVDKYLTPTLAQSE